MTNWRRVALLLSLPGLAACGRGATSASSPTPTAPSSTIASISISGPNTIFIGSSGTYTAMTMMTDGTIATTACAWTGDEAQIATVDGRTGAVTGNRSGETTLACSAQGARGTRRIRVLPNYSGHWEGSYIVEACEQTEQLPHADFCTSFPRERILPLTASLTQDNDFVSGTFRLGTIEAQTASAIVAADGSLNMSIAHTGPSTLTITSAWTLTSERAGQMAGTMVQTWNSPSGEGRVYSRILNAARGARQVLASLAN